MNGLAHLLHRHTRAAHSDTGEIVLCHRRSRTDAHIRPMDRDRWLCLHNISFDELAELIRACDGCPGTQSAADRLLFIVNAIRIRRTQAGAR